jgi:predicted MPP superfamily phosphohydrolase
MEAMLDAVTVGIRNEDFFVLLSHRPEYLEMYDQYPVDLCLTGHAHGGQFRLPFIGGVYAPGQGFFPKYTAGLYETDDLEMYVGTGVGNSAIPVRIFNPPEILTIILQKEK